MTALLYPRRFWSLTAAPLFVFFLARFIFVVGIPYYSASLNLSKEGHISSKIQPRMESKRIVSKHAISTYLPVVGVEPHLQAHGLSLQSALHDFNAIFSGQITCGNVPCRADLHVFLQSDHNASVEHVFSTTPDGRFECRMAFKEDLQKQLDWRMMIYTPHTYPAELRGRQILTEDGDLAIDQNIQLP